MAYITYTNSVEDNLDITVKCKNCGSQHLLVQRLFFEAQESTHSSIFDLTDSRGEAQNQSAFKATAAATMGAARLKIHRVWHRCIDCGHFDESSITALHNAISFFQRRSLIHFSGYLALSVVILVISIAAAVNDSNFMFAGLLLFGSVPICWIQRHRGRRVIEARINEANASSVVETWLNGPGRKVAALTEDILGETDFTKRRKLVNRFVKALHGADPIPVGYFYRQFGIKTEWELRTESWRSAGYSRPS